MSDISSVFLYLGIYFFSAICLKYSKNTKNKLESSVLFVIAIFLPIIFAALRYDVGTDYMSYLYTYKYNNDLTLGEWFLNNKSFSGTPLGVWLLSNIGGFFESSEIFYGLFAFLIFFPVVIRLREDYSKDIIFLITFLYLTSNFTVGLNIMKQAVAVGILFWGLKYVYERKFLKWCLLILIASCFHISATIGIFIYFLYTENGSAFSVRRIGVYIMVAILVANIPSILTFMGGRFASYNFYEEEVSNMSFYLDLIWLSIFLFFRKNFISLDSRNELLISMLIVAFIFQCTGFISPYLKRVTMYYTFSQSILMAQIPFLFKKDDRVILKLGIIFYLIIMFILRYFILKQSGVVPYNFISS